MHNLAWVNYVNNLRTSSSKIGVRLSTNSVYNLGTKASIWVQVVVIRFINTYYTHPLSTYKTRYFNLLNKSFTRNPQHLLLEPKKKI